MPQIEVSVPPRSPGSSTVGDAGAGAAAHARTGHPGEEKSMTQFAGQQPVPPSPTSPDYAPPSAWVGWTAFAGVLMVMIGTFHVFQGLVALFKDEYFLVGNEGLLVTIDFTGWGWTHIV